MNWKFLYDEEVFDEAPNYMGIISNGEKVLFYHGQTTDFENNVETFNVYECLQDLFVTGESILSFHWSAENEEKFINFLNSLPGNGNLSEIRRFNPDDWK